MPHAGGVATLSSTRPVGCVSGWPQAGAASASSLPGAAGCAVGGAASDERRVGKESAPHTRRTATAEGRMGASGGYGARSKDGQPSTSDDLAVRAVRLIVSQSAAGKGARALEAAASRSPARSTWNDDGRVATTQQGRPLERQPGLWRRRYAMMTTDAAGKVSGHRVLQT